MLQIKVLLKPFRTASVAINQPLFSSPTSRTPVFSPSPVYGRGRNLRSRHTLQSTPGHPTPATTALTPRRTMETSCVCPSLQGLCGVQRQEAFAIDSTEQGTQQSKGPYPVHLLQSPAWRPSVPDRTLALSRAVLEESHFH